MKSQPLYKTLRFLRTRKYLLPVLAEATISWNKFGHCSWRSKRLERLQVEFRPKKLCLGQVREMSVRLNLLIADLRTDSKVPLGKTECVATSEQSRLVLLTV